MHTRYSELNWSIIRLHPESKRPVGQWRGRSDPPDAFTEGGNTGVRLGDASGGLVDVDLDCMEGVLIAPKILPPTTTFGRASKPQSHWLYYAHGARTVKPNGVQVELRGDGCQTMIPPSTHPSGEPVEWTDGEFTNPVTIDHATLTATFHRLCVGVLVAQTWPLLGQVRARHDSILALAGGMWHAGWSVDDAAAVLLAATSLDSPDPGHREQAIRDTWEDTGRHRRGFTVLGEIVGPDLAKRIAKHSALGIPAPQLQAPDPDDGPVFGQHDLGNAERVAKYFHGRLKHFEGSGWLEWTGSVWSPIQQKEPITQAAHALKTLSETDPSDSERAWAAKCLNHSRLSNAAKLLRTLPGLHVDPIDADADMFGVTALGAHIDLTTGEVSDPIPENHGTKLLGVEYDQDAECPRFLQFLDEVFCGDKDLAAYVLRYLGSCLSASTKDQVFQIWAGGGANGKSTLIEAVCHVLGDYAQTIPTDMLLRTGNPRDSAAASPDIARMCGSRFVAGVETSPDQRWDEGLVKRLTGGDRVVARRLYQEPIEFFPTWKIVLAVNHKPRVRGTDLGFWRRVHVVPFDADFSNADNKDPELLQKLKAEGPGILNLLIAGAKQWLSAGLCPPERVIQETSEYRKSQDVIDAFVRECCLVGPDYQVPTADLWRAYKHWCMDGNEHMLGKHAFFTKMGERFRRKWDRIWLGIRLVP